MLKRYAFGFYAIVRDLEKLRYHADLSGARSLSPHDRETFIGLLARIRNECQILGLPETSEMAVFVEAKLERDGTRYDYNNLLNDVGHLDASFSKGLDRQFVFRISEENREYFQNDELFGPEVNKAFESCTSEIRNAGTCYALEQYEACVFHLMRTLERGLGSLAEVFSVPFAHTNWHNVIEQIESEIRKMDSSRFGPDWKDKQKFYSQAASQFMFLKEAWRNHVMHVRDVYDEGKARSILAHVREFMHALAAGGLKE